MITRNDLLSGLVRGGQHLRRTILGPTAQRALSFAAVLVVLGALAFSAMPAQFAQAAGPFTVNTTADTHDANTADGLCADSGGQCSLRAAVEQATASGGATTINLPPGTYQLSLGELKTGSAAGTNITLNGTGAPANTIIQPIQPGTCPATPSTCVRAFNVDFQFHGSVTVSISNVKITGGSGSTGGGGGAILDGDTGDVLNITNVVFDSNTTSAFNGGAISFTGGGTLNVQNSTFTNNSSPTGNGGAIHFLETQAGAFTIANSTFAGNSATGGALGGQSGAINVGCNICSPFSISGSTFTNNTAVQVGASGGQGGAIMLGSGALTFNFNRVVGNHAAGGGTGIYHGGSDAVTATNNWWGCNTGPGGAGCDTAVNAAGTLTTNPWIVLSNTASPNPILVNQSTTLTASFLQNSAGTPLSMSNLGVLIGLPITFNNAVLGNLSGAQTTIQSSGTATASFTANAAGAGSADAKVDNGTATANIAITEAPITGLSATNDSPTPLGRSTTLTASLVTGSDVIYQWDLGDGNAIVSGNPVTHTYGVTGTFTAIVTATNNLSSMTATTQVTITEPITYYIYLPLVMRNEVGAANLTGERISALGDSVRASKNEDDTPAILDHRHDHILISFAM